MQYTKNPPLLESAVPLDPWPLFTQWLSDAKAVGMIEPTAMTLATVDASGRPSARVVLCRGFDADGLRFFTNYQSRKGQALAANGLAAATFWWDQLERSVRFEGRVTALSAEASTAYFHTRPRGSQLGAWSSAQSQPIADRATLEATVAEIEGRFAAEDVIPLPPFWGGYCLAPDRVEFWQGRDSRLHDRLAFTADGAGAWQRLRLQP